MKKNNNRTSAAATMDELADGDLRAQLGVIGEDLRTLGRQVKQVTAQQLHSVGDRASAMAEGVGDRVREKPLQAVLIAAGVGALVGLLLWRR